MTRGLSAGMLSGIQATDVAPILFFEGQFDGGFVRFWTGFGTIVWDGKEWIGAGQLIGIGDIEENAELVATGLTVDLAGVDPALVATVIAEARQNMPGRIWVGLMSGGVIVGSPYLAFYGRLDVPNIQDGAETCTISISYENIIADLLRPNEVRYTDEAQKALYPDDRGFEFVTVIQDKEIRWTRN